MAYAEKKTLSIENARILFKNFRGEQSKFNAKGSRNFCVIIPTEDLADQLRHEGWNVKTLEPRDEDDDLAYYIQVKINYASKRPPIVHLHTKRKHSLLDERTIEMLDWAEIIGIDLIINPSPWEVNGNSGITGYLHTMHVTILEDEFADKYDDEPVPFN